MYVVVGGIKCKDDITWPHQDNGASKITQDFTSEHSKQVKYTCIQHKGYQFYKINLLPLGILLAYVLYDLYYTCKY